MTAGGGAPAEGAPDRLAILASFGDAVEASILLGRLQQAGIEACVPEELRGTAFSNLLVEPVTVRVAEKDLAAAQALLAEAPPVSP